MCTVPVAGAGPGRLLPLLLRLIFPPLALLLTLSALLFWQIQHLCEQAARVERASEVLTHGNALYRAVVDEEISLRGYLITGHPTFLATHRDAQARVLTEFGALAALLADIPSQATAIAQIQQEHAGFQAEADAAMAARDAGNAAAWSTPEILRRKQHIDQLRASFEAFLRREEGLRQSYLASAQRQTRASLWTGAVVFALIAAGITLSCRRRLLDVSATYRRATEAEARMRRFWESNIMGVMYTNVSGDIIDANDYLLRMIGYTREEVLGGHVRWADLTPKELAQADAEHFAESRAAGACAPYEKAYIAKDGRRVPVLIGYTLLNGSGSACITFVIDLTERKRAEQALAEQHAITRAITENATAALFMADARGRCVFMNPAAEAMLGLSLAEIRELPLHDVLHAARPDGRPYPAAECPIHRAQLANSRLRGHEDVFIRKGGASFPVICAVSPIVNDGREVATVLEARDITEQKRIEREREQLLDSERAARSAAERDARVKDEFLTTLSHELRTPLNAILGWTSILRKRTLDAAATARALEVVERNARAEAQLVEDLLDVSRIKAGKLRLEVLPVDLPESVESAVASRRPAAEAKQIRLETRLDRSARVVMADPGRIQQIVWNLISNAIKFTPKGGRVSVGLRREGGFAEIEVSDSGQGITADFLPHVFDRFRQADSSTTRRHGGLGLGLSLVRSLVELHGGQVRAESEGAGKGATFTVSLPLAADDEVSDPAAACAPHDLLKGVRVLVVDDEEDTRALIERLLTECDAEVLTVDSAQEALEAVPRFRPDVLLSDIGMPQQDGYQLLHALRARGADQGGRTPAVALTAFARLEDRMRALDAGYQLHVTKPVNASELIAVVASLAHRQGAWRRAG